MNKVDVVNGARAIRFLASDNARLSGILFSKSNSEKSCMIYLHGMGSGMISGKPLAFARNLPSGFSFFSFNNRGHDNVTFISKISGSKSRDIKAGLNFERFEDSVHDIAGAIDALTALGYKKFVLCGSSTGCQKIIYYMYRTKDRRVLSLVLLGPADDYNLYRKELGKKRMLLLSKCRKLIKIGKGETIPDSKIGFSAQRLDSLIDLDRVEANILNYNGKLKEFGSVTVPILAVFGSREQYKLMPIKRYFEILDVHSNSKRFRGMEIDGAKHSFEGKEDELAKEVKKWISNL